MKLTIAIDQVFDKFKRTEGIKIIQNVTSTFENLNSLNDDYFRTLSDDKQQFDDLVSGVEDTMKQRIGISSTGSLTKGGYLYNLINDTALKNKIQDLARRGVTNQMPVQDYLRIIRTTMEGAAGIPGELVLRYRQFAYGAFAQYDSLIGNDYAKELELDHFIYAGGIIETSREFCIKRNNKVFTREEAERDFPKDPTLPKTKAERQSGILNYNPVVDLGRHEMNCRHNTNWITKAQAMRLRPDLR